MSRRLELRGAIVLVAMSLLTAPSTFAERGKPFLESFTPEDYGGHPQNWSIVQDERGLLYVANLEGVLVYDGARWRGIEHPSRISAWSLARAADGTIFVGASGDVGLLRADARSVRRFVSLREHLPEPWRELGTVRQVVATPTGTLFLDERRLLRWREGRFEAWPVGDAAATHAHRFLGHVDDRVLLALEGAGLLELRGDDLEPLPGSEPLAGVEVTALVGHGGDILVGTRSSGLWLVDATAARPWNVEASAFGKAHRITGCIRLTDGRFALSTFSGGVALFDSAGGVVRVVDRAAGLPDDTVRNAGHEDPDGGLWLPLNHGIARVEVASLLELFDADHGLGGLVLAIRRHRGTLYVGTTLALYAYSRRGRFEPVAGV